MPSRPAPRRPTGGASLGIYDQLARIDPSPMVELARAVAIGARRGAGRGPGGPAGRSTAIPTAKRRAACSWRSLAAATRHAGISRRRPGLARTDAGAAADGAAAGRALDLTLDDIRPSRRNGRTVAALAGVGLRSAGDLRCSPTSPSWRSLIILSVSLAHRGRRSRTRSGLKDRAGSGAFILTTISQTDAARMTAAASHSPVDRRAASTQPSCAAARFQGDGEERHGGQRDQVGLHAGAVDGPEAEPGAGRAEQQAGQRGLEPELDAGRRHRRRRPTARPWRPPAPAPTRPGSARARPPPGSRR